MGRVVLVNPRRLTDPYFIQREIFPSGALLTLGTILKTAGHKVWIVHEVADGYKTREELLYAIEAWTPDVVGITITTLDYKPARDLCIGIKSRIPKVQVVVGGPHVSALGRENIKDPPEADIWVVGEGDKIILDIAEGKVKGGIYFPEMLPSLDSLPYPDLSLTDIRKFSGMYPQRGFPGMYTIGSRGCAFNCTFCSRSVFGRTVRHRKPEMVVEEVEKLWRDFGIREIFFHDDTFNVRHEWSYELLSLLRKRELHRKVVFRTLCRVSKKLITEELLREMKATNFWLIFFGVESGNQEMLDSMKKGITIEEVKRAFQICLKIGIKPEASFIIGMPGETPDTIKDSICLWKEIKPYWASFSRAVPFPGTDLYKAVKEKSHLLVDSFEDFSASRMLIRTDSMTAEELETWAKYLDKVTMRQKIKHLLLSHPERTISILKGSVQTGQGYKKLVSRVLRAVK